MSYKSGRRESSTSSTDIRDKEKREERKSLKNVQHNLKEVGGRGKLKVTVSNTRKTTAKVENPKAKILKRVQRDTRCKIK